MNIYKELQAGEGSGLDLSSSKELARGSTYAPGAMVASR
jgi:hypothetical protein